jgi:hypothetical protein
MLLNNPCDDGSWKVKQFEKKIKRVPRNASTDTNPQMK